MASPAELPKFIEALQKSGSITQNWDVAVSYNAKKINAKLAENFAKQNASGMIQHFDISFEDRDRKGKYSQYYHLKLGPPLIQFVSTTADPTCNLTMAVMGGQMWTKDSEGESPKENIAAGKYTISLAGLLLAAAEGSTIINEKVVDIPNPKVKKTEITVCLDFRTSSKYLIVDVKFPKDDETAMSNSKLPTMIKVKLQESDAGMHYKLATVSNEVAADNVLDLVPSKFIFVTFSPEEDQNSIETALTLLIQTHGSDKHEGDTKYVQAAWITTWKNVKVAPIPKGHTAAIFINSSFFMQKYVNKGLEALHLTEVKEGPAADGGMRVTGKWKHPLHRAKDGRWDTKPDLERLPLHPTLFWAEVPNKDYDPNKGDQHFTVTFGHGNGTDKPGTVNLSWKWSFDDEWSGKRFWRVWQKEPGGGPGFWLPMTDKIGGTYRVDFSLNKNFGSPTVDDEKFSMAVDVSANDWATPTTNTSPASGWDRFTRFFPFVKHNGFDAPRWVIDKVPKPTFTLDLHTLRFFLVTNILFPGEKVIKVDSKAGLLFPRDVVIVGDII